jgi:hypothetical protein
MPNFRCAVSGPYSEQARVSLREEQGNAGDTWCELVAVTAGTRSIML